MITGLVATQSYGSSLRVRLWLNEMRTYHFKSQFDSQLFGVLVRNEFTE